MSRVGKRPIDIPGGIKVTVDGSVINVEGPKGKLKWVMADNFKAEIKDNKLTVIRPTDHRLDMSKHGAIRTAIQNMIIGVKDGYSKQLEIVGVGFKAQAAGKKITLNLGYSHPIVYDIPEGITVATPKPTNITVSGIDKAKVGEVAAELRDFYKPEPYKGKGVRYAGEYVRHKAGKTVA